MTLSRTFLKGFSIGLLSFFLINVIAAHLLSDCGLPALLGVDFCADDIARAGFPLVFFEQGGFIPHNYFNLPNLFLDLFISIVFAAACGFAGKEKNKSVGLTQTHPDERG
ncbi:MAG: hypothetical protein IPL71_04320 [Anaerolineales bacterium]|uniref:hypothetical protein n=1 Tax=Candidatus Villigracilis proximus TaxID=3140683 RepID=UPI0031371FB9|nr:hypothetical protein [Anaerolineales bacterium]